MSSGWVCALTYEQGRRDVAPEVPDFLFEPYHYA